MRTSASGKERLSQTNNFETKAAASAFSTSFTTLGMSYLLRLKIFICGNTLRINRVALIPSIRGMMMSMITTSGQSYDKCCSLASHFSGKLGVMVAA